MPFPPPEDLLDPGIEPMSLGTHVLVDGFFTTKAIWTSLVAQMVKNPLAVQET